MTLFDELLRGLSPIGLFIAMSDDKLPRLEFSNTFAFDDVMRHMRIHHPGCPKKTCLTISARISARDCAGLKLGAAVGIELQRLVRHDFTDYDELLRSRMMTREEARAFIKPQVERILRAWRKPALKLRLVRPTSSGDN